MSGDSLKCLVTIKNPQGLHIRPIAAFVQEANRHPCEVALGRPDGERVNGKSPISLMLLAAEEGTELLLEVNGPNADAAMRILAEILQREAMDDDDEVE